MVSPPLKQKSAKIAGLTENVYNVYLKGYLSIKIPDKNCSLSLECDVNVGDDNYLILCTSVCVCTFVCMCGC